LQENGLAVALGSPQLDLPATYDPSRIGDRSWYAGIQPGLVGYVFNDNSLVRSYADFVPARSPAIDGEQLVFTNPYPSSELPAEATPLLNPGLREQIRGAKSIEFSTSEENQKAGEQPDYRIVRDEKGQLVMEKVGKEDPLADGKLNIEIDQKNTDLTEAIKQADENLKEYIREMMEYWRKN